MSKIKKKQEQEEIYERIRPHNEFLIETDSNNEQIVRVTYKGKLLEDVIDGIFNMLDMRITESKEYKKHENLWKTKGVRDRVINIDNISGMMAVFVRERGNSTMRDKVWIGESRIGNAFIQNYATRETTQYFSRSSFYLYPGFEEFGWQKILGCWLCGQSTPTGQREVIENETRVNKIMKISETNLRPTALPIFKIYYCSYSNSNICQSDGFRTREDWSRDGFEHISVKANGELIVPRIEDNQFKIESYLGRQVKELFDRAIKAKKEIEKNGL